MCKLCAILLYMSADLKCVELATILKTKVEDSVKKMSGHGGA